MSFGEKLAEIRREKGLSQRRAVAELKISQALLSHYENGTREPGLDFINRVCDYYGVTADFLLGRADENKQDKPTAVSTLMETTQKNSSEEISYAVEKYLNAVSGKLCSLINDDAKNSELIRYNLEMAEAEMMISKLKSK